MDELLKHQPSQLADERKVMFALMDRFSATIEAYKKQYASIVDKQNKDIQQRESDKSTTLKRMADSYAAAQEIARKNHNAKLESLNKQIIACQSETSSALQEQEKMLAERENREKEMLNGAYNSDENKLKKFKEVCQQVDKIVNSTSNLLGETFTGKSRFNQICDSFEPITINIQDKNQALAALEDGKKQDAEILYCRIREITESIPKKIIFNQKRTAYIWELLVLQASARAGLFWIENEYKNDHSKRKAQFDNRCANLRSETNKNKQAIIAKRDNRISNIKSEIEKENIRYNDSSAQASRKYSAECEALNNYHNDQIADARQKWIAELKKCNKTFAAHMEAQYPSKSMNAWINQFWYHPRRVEDYRVFWEDMVNADGSKKRMPEPLNVLIAMAVVDISDWVSGETGTVVKNVLKNYLALFGRNKEQAEKAYGECKKILLPYSISIEEGNSMLISHDDASDERASGIVNAIAMRLLRSVPACMMRFLLFDAGGMGKFGQLKALDPANIINPSEPTVKSLVIGEGRNHTDIANLISKTESDLSGIDGQLTIYSSIRKFNKANPMSKQIYRPLLMMNFPYGLDEENVRSLNKLTSDCSKWGFSMVLAQPDRLIKDLKPEQVRVLEDLKRKILVLRLEGNKQYLRSCNTHSVTERKAQLLMYALPDNDAMKSIAADIRRKSVEASKIHISFSEAKDICPQKKDWYSENANDGIIVPIGYLESGHPFNMQFDDTNVNAMIMGKTGSGKSNLIHVLVMNLMLRYAPEEVMLYLIDFKDGVDYRIYTQYNLPNFRAIGINSDPEYVLAMLENLEEERRQRGREMNAYGKISQYNKANPDKKKGRIIFIVDELYVLAQKASEDVRKKLLHTIDTFVCQGRSFGIHMVLCGHNLDKLEYFETTRNQCNTRLALHCKDEQVKVLLSDAAATKMQSIDETDKGACVFSIDDGKNSEIEHTAKMEEEDQFRILKDIHSHYLNKGRLTDVKVLLTRIAEDPNHPIQRFVNSGYLPEMNRRLLIGDPMSMDKALNLCPAGNLWVTGGNINEEAMDAGTSILFFATLSLLLEKFKNKSLDIVCTNCSDHPMRDSQYEAKDLLKQVAYACPKAFSYGTGENIKQTIDALCNELEDRANKVHDCDKALWWIVVRPELVTSLSTDIALNSGLKELLQRGPQYNIHTVIWNSDVKLAQGLQLNRNLFKDRICLEMTSDDCKYVNGSEFKAMPGGYKAILIRDSSMLFRTYDLPDGIWMEMLFERINERGTN